MLEKIIASLCSLVGMIPLECLQMRFMQEAFLGILLCAPLTAAVGVQVVNSRMSFFSDAIGHSAFAGIALGILCSVSPEVSMPVLGIAIGIGIMALKRRTVLSTDTVIGVFFSLVVAVGLALVSRNPNVSRNLQAFLYGDILTITDEELLWTFLLFWIFIFFQLFAYNRLISIGLNEDLARANRIHVAAYQYAFTILLSVIVILAVKTVGVLLVTALLIVPAAAARNFAKSAGSMFWISILIGLVSGIAGLLISAQEWAGTAAGATIVLCACFLFLVSLVFGMMKHKKE